MYSKRLILAPLHREKTGKLKSLWWMFEWMMHITHWFKAKIEQMIQEKDSQLVTNSISHCRNRQMNTRRHTLYGQPLLWTWENLRIYKWSLLWTNNDVRSLHGTFQIRNVMRWRQKLLHIWMSEQCQLKRLV